MIYSISEKELEEIVLEVVNKNVDGSDLRDTINEIVREKCGAINEMAYKRKEYKEKIDALSSQVIENWCLIRHCTLSGSRKYKKHWSDELRGHLLTLARYNIKGRNNWEDKEQAIREVWLNNDYNTPRSIEYVIHNKFRKEGFDTKSDLFIEIIEDCINSFDRIISLISSWNISDIDDYVSSL